MRNADPLSMALADLRATLQRGDYAALPALVTRIESLMHTLPRDDAALLRQLRQQADFTAACLSAARNGFHAARRRIADLKAGPRALGTYDRSGARAPLLPPACAEKRL